MIRVSNVWSCVTEVWAGTAWKTGTVVREAIDAIKQQSNGGEY